MNSIGVFASFSTGGATIGCGRRHHRLRQSMFLVRSAKGAPAERDFVNREIYLDSAARGDSAPRAARGDSAPRAARGDSAPRAARGDSAPRAARGDLAPRGGTAAKGERRREGEERSLRSRAGQAVPCEVENCAVGRRGPAPAGGRTPGAACARSVSEHAGRIGPLSVGGSQLRWQPSVPHGVRGAA